MWVHLDQVSPSLRSGALCGKLKAGAFRPLSHGLRHRAGAFNGRRVRGALLRSERTGHRRISLPPSCDRDARKRHIYGHYLHSLPRQRGRRGHQCVHVSGAAGRANGPVHSLPA